MPPISPASARPLPSNNKAEASNHRQPRLHLIATSGTRVDIESLEMRYGSGDQGPFDSDDIEWLLEHGHRWSPSGG